MYINDILMEKGNEVHSVDSRQQVRDAVMIMAKHDVGAVVVMEENQIKGILTKRDILSSLNQKGNVTVDYQVIDLMSNNVITCIPDDSTEHALHVMNRHQIRYLLVIEEGKLCGIVSMGDVMRASINAYQFENRLLKRYIQTWPDENRGGGLKLVVNNKFRPSTENSGAIA
ncbi:CBS domain protein [Gammaproteobacteria bacterium]